MEEAAELSGKVALVIGAARGVGRETALALAREGARVAVHDAGDRERVREAFQIITSLGQHSTRVTAQPGDPEAMRAMVHDVIAEFGGLDICVYTAHPGVARPFLETSPEDWRKALDEGLLGFVNLARAALPHMMKERFGRIIFVGSIAARQANLPSGDLFALQAAAHGGVMALIRPLAQETARHGVTINAVAEGYIDTAPPPADEYEAAAAPPHPAAASIPAGRLGKTAEVASVITFLASDASSYVTGQVIGVNGGLHM